MTDQTAVEPNDSLLVDIFLFLLVLLGVLAHRHKQRQLEEERD